MQYRALVVVPLCAMLHPSLLALFPSALEINAIIQRTVDIAGPEEPHPTTCARRLMQSGTESEINDVGFGNCR